MVGRMAGPNVTASKNGGRHCGLRGCLLRGYPFETINLITRVELNTDVLVGTNYTAVSVHCFFSVVALRLRHSPEIARPTQVALSNDVP
ncbi:hypothetical protein F2P81_004808 [Scophthalmus maximus]|uniref:Uncharacterized protein n=1 Tax=Scophthalmus maximus TaxID=52904 RepID=A0A6A4TKU5_SCOMX|nr:hypothetical protein F2P81_004808 [Scophthalmus maximus]